MEPFNFGIIGTGRIAAKFCSAFSQGLISGGRILAAASRDINRAEEFGGTWGISRVYGGYEKLLGDPEIDIVYIATPNKEHFPCCELAIRRGKHILCEKPMSIRAADARTLAAEAEQGRVFLMEALWTRFLPAIQKAKEWIRIGRIGKPWGLKASLCAYRDPTAYPRLFDSSGGGALLDLGVYGLHLARHFTENRNLLDIKSISIPGANGVDLTDLILLHYTGGFTAEISCSIGFFAPNEAYILGDRGYIRISPWFNFARRIEIFTPPFTGPDNYQGTAPEDTFTDVSSHGFEFEIMHIMDCIRRGKTQSDVVPLADTIETNEIMDRVIPPVSSPSQSVPG